MSARPTSSGWSTRSRGGPPSLSGEPSERATESGASSGGPEWPGRGVPRASRRRGRMPPPADLASLRHRPLVSILMPVFDTDPEWLGRAVESVRRQTYPHWQLCIADDGSTNAPTRDYLATLAGDPAISVISLPREPGDRRSHEQCARGRIRRVRRVPRPRRRARPGGVARVRSRDRRAPGHRRRLHRRGQDRPARQAKWASPQARLVARVLSRRDVRRPPARDQALARRAGRRARLGVRRGPGLRADAARVRADRAHRARAADPLPLADAPSEHGELDRREGRHLGAAGAGGRPPPRADRGRRDREAEPEVPAPGDRGPGAARALAARQRDRPDARCAAASRALPRPRSSRSRRIPTTR